MLDSYPNLRPGLKITGIDQMGVVDITYIQTLVGLVHLAIGLDLYPRKVIGCAISIKIDAKLCLGALNDALEKRRLGSQDLNITQILR